MHRSRGNDVLEILGAIIQVVAKPGVWTTPAELFFCLVYQVLLSQLQVFTIFGHDMSIHVPSKIFERNFPNFSISRSFAAKKHHKIDVSYSDQRTAQWTPCREILSNLGLFSTTYNFRATRHQMFQKFCILAYFSDTECLKRTFW